MPAQMIKIKFAYTPTKDMAYMYRCVANEEYKPNPRRNLMWAFLASDILVKEEDNPFI